MDAPKKTPPTLAQIRALLEISDVAVEEGILRLHARQTQDEQRAKDTKHQNQRGFSAAHARRGSKYAEWIIGMRRDHGAKPGEGLRRQDHKVAARQLILHYAGQLHQEAVTKWTAAQTAAMDERMAENPAWQDDVERRQEAQARLDAEEAEETALIQQADLEDAERAAHAKAVRDGFTDPGPGTLVETAGSTVAWPDPDSSTTLKTMLKAGTTCLVVGRSRMVPHVGRVTKVLQGQRVLWVPTAILRVLGAACIA